MGSRRGAGVGPHAGSKPSHRTKIHTPGGFTAERVGKDLKLDLCRSVKNDEMVGDTGIEPVASSV